MAENATAEKPKTENPPADVMLLENGEINPNFREANSLTVESKGQSIKVVPDLKRATKQEKKDEKGNVVKDEKGNVVMEEAEPEIIFVPSDENTTADLMKFFGDEFIDSILRARGRQVFIAWTEKASEKDGTFNEEFFKDLAKTQKYVPVKLGELKEKFNKKLKELAAFMKRLTDGNLFDYENNSPKEQADQDAWNKISTDVAKLNMEVTAKSRKRKKKGDDEDEE